MLSLISIHNHQAAFIRIGFDNADASTQKRGTNKVNRALFSPAEPVQKTVLEFKPVLVGWRLQYFER